MLKKFRFLILTFVIILAGFFLYPTGALDPLKNAFYLVGKPFAVVGNITTNRVTVLYKQLSHLSSLIGENQLLIKENLELQSKLSNLKEVQHENEVLKTEIGLNQSLSGSYNLTPASIVGRAATGYLKTVVIDRGAKDNLKVGQAVISQGFLVGTVKQVYADTAEVNLITDYNSIVPVLLQDSRGTGLLRGGLAGLTVEDIPLNVAIKPGEPVVTSGLGGDIPAGISVGKVQEVVSKEGEIFQKVTIQSPVKIYFLEFVFIVNV